CLSQVFLYKSLFHLITNVEVQQHRSGHTHTNKPTPNYYTTEKGRKKMTRKRRTKGREGSPYLFPSFPSFLLFPISLLPCFSPSLFSPLPSFSSFPLFPSSFFFPLPSFPLSRGKQGRGEKRERKK